ncbi:FAD:protein FMN transferase [Streptomyces sp. NPDC007851]|uniref:FAD:protein FMN transferase n=1 Tax=Streptomyces sp. NPDC007851 TaxID=3155008 RepID=UPI0033CC73A8
MTLRTPRATAAADWRALGTTVRVVVTDPALLDSCNLLLARQLAEVDAACSRFRTDSELAALDGADGRPVRVSPLLAEALGVALRAAETTDGAVDPAIGSAMAAIGYDRDFTLVREDDRPVPETSPQSSVSLSGPGLETEGTVIPWGRGAVSDVRLRRVGATGPHRPRTRNRQTHPANSSNSSASLGRPTRSARTPDSTARNSVHPRSRS